MYELDDVEPLHAEPKEDVEIVVTARLKNIQYVTASSGVGSGNQYYSTKVLNFSIEAEPILISDTTAQSALRTTATAIGAIATGIETILAAAEAAGAPLPKGEKARLTALSETLHVASTGLKTGTIDQTTAHKMVAGAFAVAWDAGGAAVVSVTMAALAATATAYAPAPPHIKALVTVGTGLLGFMIEGTIGNSKLYDELGKLTADALFWSGSKVSEIGTALSNLLSTIMDAAAAALNPFNRNPYKDLDLSTFDASPGDDDIEGVAVEFTNYGAFQDVAPEQVTLQTVFYRSADGPGWVTDEPIAGRMLEPRGTGPEPLFIDAPIG